MRKVTEFLLSLFFSKEAIALVKQEAAQEAKSAITKYQSRKFLTVKKRYTKV